MQISDSMTLFDHPVRLLWVTEEQGDKEITPEQLFSLQRMGALEDVGTKIFVVFTDNNKARFGILSEDSMSSGASFTVLPIPVFGEKT